MERNPWLYVSNFQSLKAWVKEHAEKELGKALVSEPVKKNILALDLDNTVMRLGHASPHEVAYYITASDNRYSIIPRPGLKEFVDAIRPWFSEVGIFTSSGEEYASKSALMLARQGHLGPMDFVLSRNSLAKDKHEETYWKNLWVVPGSKKDLTNVLLVDDDPSYPPPEQGDNVLHMPGYGSHHGKAHENFLSEEGVLMLRHLSQMDDMPAEMKRLKMLWKDAGFIKETTSARFFQDGQRCECGQHEQFGTIHRFNFF